MEYLKYLQSEFQDKVDFLMVYIREAHASDEWPLGKLKCIPQHKTLEDRIKVASELVEQYGFTIHTVVDSIDNRFNSEFHVWPERYFLFSGHSLEYVSQPSTEFGFDRLELRSILGTFTGRELGELLACKYPVFSTNPLS